MTEFIDKRKKYRGISNSMNHYSQFTSLWQFDYKGSEERKVKSPRNSFLKKLLTYLASPLLLT